MRPMGSYYIFSKINIVFAIHSIEFSPSKFCNLTTLAFLPNTPALLQAAPEQLPPPRGPSPKKDVGEDTMSTKAMETTAPWLTNNFWGGRRNFFGYALGENGYAQYFKG